MTDNQRAALQSALNSREVQTILNKLRLQVRETDVESCVRYPKVLQIKARSHQIEERERVFAQITCVKQHDDVLLLGNTTAVEGFFLASKQPLQMKGVGEDKLEPPPGAFVQAFLQAWQKSRGWMGIWLYIDAPKITVEFARQRWNTAGTDPKLEQHHLNRQIGRIFVHCSNGWTELPLQLATA